MSQPDSLVSANPTGSADRASAIEETENTPLLGDIQPQERTRRTSSLVGNAEHGYHIIPPTVPEESSEPSPQNLRAVLGILSVLLVGW